MNEELIQRLLQALGVNSPKPDYWDKPTAPVYQQLENQFKGLPQDATSAYHAPQWLEAIPNTKWETASYKRPSFGHEERIDVMQLAQLLGVQAEPEAANLVGGQGFIDSLSAKVGARPQIYTSDETAGAAEGAYGQFSDHGTPKIWLEATMPQDTARFALAHEYGHLKDYVSGAPSDEKTAQGFAISAAKKWPHMNKFGYEGHYDPPAWEQKLFDALFR